HRSLPRDRAAPQERGHGADRARPPERSAALSGSSAGDRSLVQPGAPAARPNRGRSGQMNRETLVRRSGPVVALALLLAAPSALAQPYARFAVPDSLLQPRIAKAGGQFESAWNALLVAEVRASDARADSARRLQELARRVAKAEEPARGTRIASTALALRGKWSAAQRRVRVRAAVSESLATVAQGARRWNEADSLFQRALADYRSLREQRREAWVLGSIGLVAFTRGDIARADSVYRLALAARQRIGDASMIGNTLNSLGSTHYLNRDYPQARSYLEAA